MYVRASIYLYILIPPTYIFDSLLHDLLNFHISGPRCTYNCTWSQWIFIFCGGGFFICYIIFYYLLKSCTLGTLNVWCRRQGETTAHYSSQEISPWRVNNKVRHTVHRHVEKLFIQVYGALNRHRVLSCRVGRSGKTAYSGKLIKRYLLLRK